MPKPRVRRVQEIDVNKIHFQEATENSFGGKQSISSMKTKKMN